MKKKMLTRRTLERKSRSCYVTINYNSERTYVRSTSFFFKAPSPRWLILTNLSPHRSFKSSVIYSVSFKTFSRLSSNESIIDSPSKTLSPPALHNVTGSAPTSQAPDQSPPDESTTPDDKERKLSALITTRAQKQAQFEDTVEIAYLHGGPQGYELVNRYGYHALNTLKRRGWVMDPYTDEIEEQPDPALWRKFRGPPGRPVSADDEEGVGGKEEIKKLRKWFDRMVREEREAEQRRKADSKPGRRHCMNILLIRSN